MRRRPTARLLVIDRSGRLLLFKIEDHELTDPPDPQRPTTFWIAPGGGVEEGETFEQAALRELWEETGIRPEALGLSVLERDILLREGNEDILFQTRYFLVRVETTEVSLTGMSGQDHASYREHRWWSVDALEHTRETIFPEELPAILRNAGQS